MVVGQYSQAVFEKYASLVPQAADFYLRGRPDP